MKRAIKVVSLAIGSVMVAATLAACGGGGGGGGAKKSESVTICFDNYAQTAEASYLSASDTQAVIKDAKDFKAYDASGGEVGYEDIVSYDSSSGTFTAVAEGRVTFTAGGVHYTLNAVPAYATDPGNQYSGNVNDFNLERGASVLGNTHDPSFIETKDENGNVSYYLFSTGWGTGNDVHVSYDGMRTWEYVGKTTQADDYDNEKIFPDELKEWMNSEDNGGDIQWWAPDIVPAKDGGYWFYTCLVMNDDRMPMLNSSSGALTPSCRYSRACIVMYYISDLGAIGDLGAVEYKGVLMQSAIPQNGNGSVDVNAIDPQIIYTPEDKMYMAFGSFGTGNWMVELNPKTGLRADGVNDWKDWEWVRRQRNFVVSGNEERGVYPGGHEANTTECGKKLLAGEEYNHPYYGRMISVGAMEAPIIARHDNVKIFDETTENPDAVEGKTYYYSMHSYNGLANDYQMWGGRSESVLGAYRSTGGGYVYNVNFGVSANQGNKYMGGFKWQNNAGKEYPSCLTGHNDLYTTESGVNVAAYINRNYQNVNQFFVQVHQYYLNSKGDICINANRYGGEIDRGVSEEELFALTDGKFEMVVLTNGKDWDTGAVHNVSRTVTLDKATHEIKEGDNKIGTWVMYGKGYIKFTFDATLKGSGSYDSNETVYYGVVRPSWLTNLNKSGFTVSCMGNTSGTSQSMAMFMNSHSTITL